MADKKHKGKADITPILESFSKMTNVNNASQNTTQKSPREDVCDQNIERALEQAAQKLTPGLQVKRSGGNPTEQQPAERPETGEEHPRNNAENRQQREDRTTRSEDSLLKIHGMFESLSNTVKELAKSMGSVQRQVKTVKDKQDKYESGWEDPYQDEYVL